MESKSVGESSEYLMFGPPLDASLRACRRLSREPVQHLQDWLRSQPHLPRLHDEDLVPFFCSCDHDLESAKRCIDKYFTMRTNAPDVFADRDPTLEMNRSQWHIFHTAALRARAPDGCRVVYMGYQPVSLAGMSQARTAHLSLALMELVVREEPTCDGYAFVLDARHLSLGHMARASLHVARVLMTFVQEAAPLRMRSVHVINVTWLASKALLFLKPFLSKEIQRMLHFHSGSMEEFYKQIPKEILPVECGGTCGSTADYHQELLDKLLANRDWVMSMENHTVDESKRPLSNGRRVK